ncbi:MAG TPA: hypothetical protein VFX59_01940 [Polyangiales bacterium]|nr:hypothetical protein [Polyangiales bacterium]
MGTIDQAVERERDRKAKSDKEDPREGPGNTGAAKGSDLPDDDGASAKPNQPHSTPMAGKKP